MLKIGGAKITDKIVDYLIDEKQSLTEIPGLIEGMAEIKERAFEEILVDIKKK